MYPHDTTDDDPTEPSPSTQPFFQATFQPQRFVPSFPFSLSWITRLGIDIGLVQPPLPEGKGAQGELPGTDRWCKITPGQSTKRATFGWIDLSQKDQKTGAMVTSVTSENFWPRLGRWQLAIKLEDSEIDFGEGTYWDGPKTML